MRRPENKISATTTLFPKLTLTQYCMKNVENVVDFADLCIFAEQNCGVCYNAAHDVLFKDAYPYLESSTREIYLSEMSYCRNEESKQILTAYMNHHGVSYITVLK